ncbi:MAG: DMT family transporter [Pseudomonadota bacterium]
MSEIALAGPPSRPAARYWLLLFFLAVIWGASFMAGKVGLTGFGPVTLAAVRISIAAATLTAVAWAIGLKFPAWSAPRGPRVWAHVLGMALFTNAIPFTLLAWGQLRVTSGFAGITMAVVPLLVLPLAHCLVPGETMNRWKATGFAVGFVGTVVLVGGGALGSAGSDLEGLARLACVGAACCYALGSIITRLCPPVLTLVFAAAGLCVAAILSVPTALFIEGVPAAPGWTAFLAVLFLGLFPTALATVVLVSIIKGAGPSFLSLVNYQVPVLAIIFGVVFIGEPLPGQFLGALGLILLGLMLSQLRGRAVHPDAAQTTRPDTSPVN